MTPLHYSSIEGHLEVIKYLLYKGADINGKDINIGINSFRFLLFISQLVKDILRLSSYY